MQLVINFYSIAASTFRSQFVVMTMETRSWKWQAEIFIVSHFLLTAVVSMRQSPTKKSSATRTSVHRFVAGEWRHFDVNDTMANELHCDIWAISNVSCWVEMEVGRRFITGNRERHTQHLLRGATIPHSCATPDILAKGHLQCTCSWRWESVT